MKLKTIILAFTGITQVFDSIKDFSRKWELIGPYNELKSLIDLFEHERHNMVKDLFVDGVMPKNSEYEANQRVNQLLLKEVQLQNKLLFTMEEVQNSNIKGSELSNIMDFIKQK